MRHAAAIVGMNCVFGSGGESPKPRKIPSPTGHRVHVVQQGAINVLKLVEANPMEWSKHN